MGIGEKIAVNAPFGVSQTKDLLNAAIGIGELRQHMGTEVRAQAKESPPPCSAADPPSATTEHGRAYRTYIR